MTPGAMLDSGQLDLSVITARNRLSAFTQVMTVMLRGKPVHTHSRSSRSTLFRVSAPASVDVQLDGSAVKLRKYLTAAAQDAIARSPDPARVTVHYRFDAVPASLPIAIPRGYGGPLFRG